MLWSLATTFVLSALREAVKNPERKAAIRERMLEIANLINTVFGTDPAFQSRK
ncbi:MAG TPA: hypothetical protein PLD20_05740 [Blastocatellia bacterium]|nr:hypothetical protein [Blastocatellia bacterium]HMV87624.1 hypothetical protein [Blastocatellia bacterium]HMZ17409.1 hypothetical protein [Blastocatellia bacterium]HNG29219.1 hypothetical protein [Blastocatellia bacterium]